MFTRLSRLFATMLTAAAASAGAAELRDDAKCKPTWPGSSCKTLMCSTADRIARLSRLPRLDDF
eukprot:gene6823-6513_t